MTESEADLGEQDERCSLWSELSLLKWQAT